jgi:hypothetical protein
MSKASDSILIQATATADQAQSVASSDAWLTELAKLTGLGDLRSRLAWSAAQQELYLYLNLPSPGPVDGHHLKATEAWFKRSFPAMSKVRASRLTKVFDIPGASSEAGPVFHYIVETDPETGWAEEIARWYDIEHMPGLASVTGCVRAMRFINHDQGPVSCACYDLVSVDTLGSEPWLAVRHSDWSSRVRPHFTNTKRTMVELLPRRID